LMYAFAADGSEIEVRIDTEGPHVSPAKPRRCAADCPAAVSPPVCTGSQLGAALKDAGLRGEERAVFTYSDAPSSLGGRGALWAVTVDGRGTVKVGSACKPVAGERFTPDALPVSAIRGAPDAVDVVDLVSMARQQSGLGDEAALLEIDARGVRPDGRLSLTSAEPSIVYTFAEPPTPSGRRWREVKVSAAGMPVTSTVTDMQPLPDRLRGDPPPLPRCSAAFAIKTAGNVPNVPLHVVFSVALAESGSWRVEADSSGLHHTISDSLCSARETLEEPAPAAPDKPSAPPKKRSR
jgi:hypothetical protein